VEIKESAAKALAALSKPDQKRIQAKIDALAEEPRPRGVKKLKGPEGFLRLRVGDYRIVYSVHDDVLLVLVVRIGHRGDVYRKRHRGKK
jgi:mRNA interferase RelE/StbE